MNRSDFNRNQNRKIDRYVCIIFSDGFENPKIGQKPVKKSTPAGSAAGGGHEGIAPLAQCIDCVDILEYRLRLKPIFKISENFADSQLALQKGKIRMLLVLSSQ